VRTMSLTGHRARVERVDSGIPLRDERAVEPRHVPDLGFRHEAQRQKYLPKLATGEWSAFGLTEPDQRFDPGSMATRAKKGAGGYRLTGNKMWIPNAPIADVFGRLGQDEDGVIRGFVLEKGMEGLRAPKIQGKFSLRASATGEIVMERCSFLRRTCSPASQGCAAPSPSNGARYGIAWERWAPPNSAGTQRATITSNGASSGEPLAANQLIQKSSSTCRPRSRSGSPLVRLGRSRMRGLPARGDLDAEAQ